MPLSKQGKHFSNPAVGRAMGHSFQAGAGGAGAGTHSKMGAMAGEDGSEGPESVGSHEHHPGGMDTQVHHVSVHPHPDGGYVTHTHHRDGQMMMHRHADLQDVHEHLGEHFADHEGQSPPQEDAREEERESMAFHRSDSGAY